jgi:hypothetical protein
VGNPKGGFVKFLKTIFPELNLDAAKFHRLSIFSVLYSTSTLTLQLGNFWHDIKNQRKWFLAFAENRGFDPLVAENWYNINFQTLHFIKVRLVHTTPIK